MALVVEGLMASLMPCWTRGFRVMVLVLKGFTLLYTLYTLLTA
jgi:hypothetical protein